MRHDPPCPLCGNADANIQYRTPALLVHRCPVCQLMYVQPLGAVRSNEAGQHARALGRRYMREVFEDHHEFWIGYWRQQYRRMQPHIAVPRPRLLDVGCAMGHFMVAAQQEGAEAIGVEMSGEQAAYARDKLSLDVRTGLFEDAGFEFESFDVVTLWSVIEHVRDPRSFMSKVHQLLKPGGLVVVKTPNCESLITDLAHLGYVLSGGRYLLAVFSDEHIFRFSVKTIQRLLRETRFKVLDVRQEDHLRIMKLRMQVQPNRLLRNLALTSIHALARLLHKENQLLVYAVKR